MEIRRHSWTNSKWQRILCGRLWWHDTWERLLLQNFPAQKKRLPRGDRALEWGRNGLQVSTSSCLVFTTRNYIPLWSIIYGYYRERDGELASFHSEEEITAVLKKWDQKMDTGLWMGLVAYSKLELKIFWTWSLDFITWKFPNKKGDGLGLGPYWRWTDSSDHKGFRKWQDGFPQNLFTSTAQCGVLTKDGEWRNLDCISRDEPTAPSQHVCKAKKVPFLQPPGPNDSPGKTMIRFY